MHLHAFKLRGSPFAKSFEDSTVTLIIPNKSLTITSYVPWLKAKGLGEQNIKGSTASLVSSSSDVIEVLKCDEVSSTSNFNSNIISSASS